MWGIGGYGRRAQRRIGGATLFCGGETMKDRSRGVQEQAPHGFWLPLQPVGGADAGVVVFRRRRGLAADLVSGGTGGDAWLAA